MATKRQRNCLRRMGLYPRPAGAGRLTRQQAWLLINEQCRRQRHDREVAFNTMMEDGTLSEDQLPEAWDSWMDDYQVTGSIPGDR